MGIDQSGLDYGDYTKHISSTEHRFSLDKSKSSRQDRYYCTRQSSRTHDTGDKNKAARLTGAPLIKYGATPAAAEELKLQAEKFALPLLWKISPELV